MLRIFGIGVLVVMLAAFAAALMMGIAVQLLVFFVAAIATVVLVGFVLSRLKGPPPGDAETF